jgi:uncharacterized protein YkwD
LARDEKEREMVKWNKEVTEYNEKFTGATKEEKEVLEHVNAYRNMMGLPSVKFDENLMKAASHHSSYVCKTRNISHYEEEENFKDPLARAKYYGYKGSSAAENIGVYTYSPTPKEVFERWYKSSGHHRSMLLNFVKYGAVAKVRTDQLEVWTLLLGGN